MEESQKDSSGLYDASEFEINQRLENYSKLENVRCQTPSVQLFVAEGIKQAGNSFFVTGDYLTALKKYTEALSIFRYFVPLVQDWRNSKSTNTLLDIPYPLELSFCDFKECDTVYEISKSAKKDLEKLLAGIYLNKAACHLKIANFQACIDNCNMALEFNDKLPKAQ